MKPEGIWRSTAWPSLDRTPRDGAPPFLRAFEAALNAVDLKHALRVLGDVPKDLIQEGLKEHSLDKLPVWHYLARARFKEEDRTWLNELIQYYLESGYDINKTTDAFVAQKRASLGFTALLAAIEQCNGILLDVLISAGANVNLRDKSGFSPLHWSILVGDMKNLKKLIDAGVVVESTLEEQMGVVNVHPILHTAVDEGRHQMVFYLIKEKLVPIDEEAVYHGILSERALTSFPSRYNCANTDEEANGVLETVSLRFTALGRAVRMRKIPIIEILLKHDAKLTNEFGELHFCIVEGDTEVACLIKEYFTEEELAADKIGTTWALHCLHMDAFQRMDPDDDTRIEKTKELINEYIKCGWDVKSVSECLTSKVKPGSRWFTSNLDGRKNLVLKMCSLLHIACLHKGHSVVRFLVESGADVNAKCTIMNEACVSPLHISLLVGDWDSAMYLVEKGADVKALGHFFKRDFTEVARYINAPSVECDTCSERPEHFQSFNSIELLLRISSIESEKLLNLMVSKADVGANEVHIAIEGGSPRLVLTVVKSMKTILSPDELNWITVKHQTLRGLCQDNDELQTVLSLNYLLKSPESTQTVENFEDLKNLMKAFNELGYNFNLRTKHGPGVQVVPDDPLIFKMFLLDFKIRRNFLLPAIMEFDSVDINVKLEANVSLIQAIFNVFSSRCMNHLENCWRPRQNPTYCHEVISLLISRGADVSDWEIGPSIKYHSGCSDVFKVLFSAGARILPEFFDDPMCHPGYVACRSFKQEIVELCQWMQDTEKAKVTLKFLCMKRLRNSMRTVGDIKIMLDRLPTRLKNEVLYPRNYL